MRVAGVNMRDVAALAGVSVGTVSNVINSPHRVSVESTARVNAAIAKLGWVRNESARQLRAGRSLSVGVVVLDVSNPFFTDIVQGIEDSLAAEGFTTYIGSSGHSADRQRTHLERFEQDRVGGVLLAPVGEVSREIQRLRGLGIPVVLLDRAASASEACSVAVDDIEGGQLAAQHLLERGHRSIVFVGGPARLAQVGQRLRGARYAAQGFADASVMDLRMPALDLESGVAAAAEIAGLPTVERPTGVFAANDLLAIGLLQGLLSHGLRVPEDVALVGYDDIDFAAAAAVPLSSIHQPRREMGAAAAHLLIEEIRQSAGEKHKHTALEFTPQLRVRHSTAVRAHPFEQVTEPHHPQSSHSRADYTHL
jgi:LacI family transcriptional regulator